MLAAEQGGSQLALAGSQPPESGAQLIDLASVLRPVARALRRDRPIVMRLSLAEQLADGS
jgi:hypothetical protein